MGDFLLCFPSYPHLRGAQVAVGNESRRCVPGVGPSSRFHLFCPHIFVAFAKIGLQRSPSQFPPSTLTSLRPFPVA